MSAHKEDNEPLKFPNPKRTKVHDPESEARDKALLKGRTIYEDWRVACCSHPCKPFELVTRLFVLRDLLKKNLSHPEVLDTMLKEVDVAIKNAAEKYPAPKSPKATRTAKRDAWAARAAAKGGSKARGASGGRASRNPPPEPGDAADSGNVSRN